MRNGDFTPTRLQCQQDAANLIIHCKLRSNPENAIACVYLRTVEVLSALTQENSKLFLKLHQLQPKGVSNVLGGIKIAHLALKHRQNRNHKMRIVVFIGSPLENIDSNELLKLSKKLKKEKVVVDIICFGEADEDSSDIFGQFIESLNSRENGGSNLIVVSSGSTLTEALASSSICRGADGAAAAIITSTGGGFEFGIDPEDDPDLALALRVSLEEQRQRQMQDMNADVNEIDNIRQQADNAGDLANMDPESMTEDQQLAWALRMSMQDGMQSSSEVKDSNAATAIAENETMEIDNNQDNPGSREESDQLGLLVNNPELLRQLVDDLPGVDSCVEDMQNKEKNSGSSDDKDRK